MKAVQNYTTLFVLVSASLVIAKSAFPQCDPSTCARGRPGKQGPKGDTGICEVCNGKGLTKEIEKTLQELQKKVESLVVRIESLEADPKPDKPKFPDGLCHVIYRGKCVWVIYHGLGVNYADAAELCRKDNGGKLANIYDEAHYNMIVDSVRSRLPAFLNFQTLWLGMKYNPQTKDTTFSDGKKSTFQRWYPGTPFPSNTDMIIWIARKPSEKSQGMWNYGRNTIHHGSLCELNANSSCSKS